MGVGLHDVLLSDVGAGLHSWQPSAGSRHFSAADVESLQQRLRIMDGAEQMSAGAGVGVASTSVQKCS